ncbi:low-temperature-induced 65 kDa protein [Solanum dulcamara]|uniref:low-temperature-induced 65 kDa protein n=1 Tax=Solanum dulcamara TaxID=45834 RepID=UPI0024863C77|nr:low-temperature-induced 65 kDa protein [Solanum dulcamara]
MEAQLHRPQETGLHSGEGQGQVDEGEHHPKQSMLTKVKAKAKKIKDHLKHGLGHEQDHEHDQEHHSLQDDEEEETDDVEMEEGEEVDGGPYAVRSKDIPKEDIVPMGNLENPTSPKEDRYDSKMKNEEVHRPILPRQDEFATPPSLEGTHFPEERDKPPFTETQGIDDHVTALGKHEDQGLQGHENFIGAPTGLVDHHAAHRPVTAAETHETKGSDHVTAPGKQDHQVLQGHENITGAPTGLEEHHAAHRPVTAAETHETKGFDHVTSAPGEEGHQGLQGHEINIGAPTGLENPNASHFREQIHSPHAAADTGVHEELNDQGLQGHKFRVLTSLKEDANVPKDRPNTTNYQSKVTDPTGANNEEAGVGPLVHSFGKMGVNDGPETTGVRTEPRAAGDIKFDQGTEHSQHTGSHDQFAPQDAPVDFPSVSKDTESVPKSMNPSNPADLPEDTLTGKPDSYTDKVSFATSAIADKAVSAKNLVASKLGYGGTEVETRDTQVTGGEKDATKTNSATALAQKHASTVTEKLASVYEKVAGENRGGANAEHKVKTDKGVSMKESLAEKFKPGEEDRALSEVISGSLSRHKDKTEETGEAKPMGKVTESEEVERRLGSIGDTKKEEDDTSGEIKVGEGFGQGVVDRVKGAVSTWLGKGGEAQANDSGVDGGAVVGGTRG